MSRHARRRRARNRRTSERTARDEFSPEEIRAFGAVLSGALLEALFESSEEPLSESILLRSTGS